MVALKVQNPHRHTTIKEWCTAAATSRIATVRADISVKADTAVQRIITELVQ
jgi:hypothetical protein